MSNFLRFLEKTTHCGKIIIIIIILIVLFRKFTWQHRSRLLCLNDADLCMRTNINDFVLRRPLFWLFRRPVEQPLVKLMSLSFFSVLPFMVNKDEYINDSC